MGEERLQGRGLVLGYLEGHGQQSQAVLLVTSLLETGVVGGEVEEVELQGEGTALQCVLAGQVKYTCRWMSSLGDDEPGAKEVSERKVHHVRGGRSHGGRPQPRTDGRCPRPSLSSPET